MEQGAGPGAVSFKNADSVETLATFSQSGDYIAHANCREGKLVSSSTLKVLAVAPPPKERLDVIYTKRYCIESPPVRSSLSRTPHPMPAWWCSPAGACSPIM